MHVPESPLLAFSRIIGGNVLGWPWPMVHWHYLPILMLHRWFHLLASQCLPVTLNDDTVRMGWADSACRDSDESVKSVKSKRNFLWSGTPPNAMSTSSQAHLRDRGHIHSGVAESMMNSDEVTWTFVDDSDTVGIENSSVATDIAGQLHASSMARRQPVLSGARCSEWQGLWCMMSVAFK